MTLCKLIGAITVGASIAVAMACSPSSRINGAAVTLTGCLQPGDTPGTFRLISTGKPNTAVGTSGSRESSGDVNNPTGSPAQSNSSDIGAATTKVYNLVPSQTVDLSREQDTVVRITGRFENRQGATGTMGSNNGPVSDQNRGANNRSAQGQVAAQSGRQARQGSGANSANPATGEGPESSTRRQQANRPIDTIHVDSVQRIAETCAGAAGNK